MMLMLGALLAANVAGLRDCEAADLSLRARMTGEREVSLTVTNRGRRPCLLDAHPGVTFATRGGRALPIAWRNPFRAGGLQLGHGPVVVPARIAPGAQVRATVTLTATDAASRAYVRGARVTIAGGVVLRAVVRARLCYAADGSTTFDQTRFGTDV